MLPHNHLLVAGLVIVPVGIVFFPEKSSGEIGKWVLIGGLLSSAIDLDVYALTILQSRKEKRLKPFRNPVEIYRKYKLYMDTITETGVLKAGLKTHLFSSLFIILIGCFLTSYLIPIILGVVAHLISDIPNLQRLLALNHKK